MWGVGGGWTGADGIHLFLCVTEANSTMKESTCLQFSLEITHVLVAVETFITVKCLLIPED